jgi:hypothetical protein
VHDAAALVPWAGGEPGRAESHTPTG